MHHDRRQFIRIGLAGSAAYLAGCADLDSEPMAATEAAPAAGDGGPVILSTWNHGLPANRKAWEVLGRGGAVLDAVEQGVMVVESDLANRSVGLGGLPDRDGHVTLDA
ncbi:MAG: isoaspartyl peptidase/L-asparaginase, partial [Flavobacteriales bacterium]